MSSIFGLLKEAGVVDQLARLSEKARYVTNTSGDGVETFELFYPDSIEFDLVRERSQSIGTSIADRLAAFTDDIVYVSVSGEARPCVPGGYITVKITVRPKQPPLQKV